MSESNSSIESTLNETRLFPPPAGIAEKAWIRSRAQYEQMYRE
jgi:hypothetical protein